MKQFLYFGYALHDMLTLKLNTQISYNTLHSHYSVCEK